MVGEAAADDGGLPGARVLVASMGTEELEEGLCKTWGSIYGWPRPWVVEWTVSVGVQTEEVSDFQDMIDLFAPVESPGRCLRLFCRQRGLRRGSTRRTWSG